MDNVADTQEYKNKRERLEKAFEKYSLINGKDGEEVSPSGNYKICISRYETGKDSWDYTKGTIYNKQGEEFFVILRNYSDFWYEWIEHKNGNEYLLCGEDYQGYVVLNLTQKIKHTYFPEEGFKGCGFCWIGVKNYNEDSSIIEVEGCYWACPFEIVTYDFSDPDTIPLKELSRQDSIFEDDDDDDDDEVEED